MAGLITINKLIDMLLQEIEAFDSVKYSQILLEKGRINIDIEKNRATPYLINKLSNELLPEQIRFVSYYSDRLPRLQRIVNILSKSKRRISKAQQREYDALMDLLNILIIIAKKNLKSVLEDQKEALDKQKLRKYLKHVNKEHKIGYEFVKPLSRLGKRIRKPLGVEQSVRSINSKRLIVVEALVTLIVLSIVGVGTYKGVSSYYAVDFNPAKLVSLEECRRQIGTNVKFNNSTKIEDINRVIRRYVHDDLEKETAMETELESLTGVQLLGDYTSQDLQLTKTFLEKTYGFDISRSVKSITFLPPKARLFKLDVIGGKCFSQEIGGETSGFSRDIVLISSSNRGPIVFQSTLSHELAHRFHNSIYSQMDFDKKWNSIKGGYASKYGRTNNFEDVATVVEESKLPNKSS